MTKPFILNNNNNNNNNNNVTVVMYIAIAEDEFKRMQRTKINEINKLIMKCCPVLFRELTPRRVKKQGGVTTH